MNVGIILSIGAGILMGAALMWFVLHFPVSQTLVVPQKLQWVSVFLAKIRPILSLKSVYKVTVAGVITVLTVLVIDVSVIRSQDVTQQGIANYDLQTGAMQISTDLYATNGNVGIGTTSPQEKLDVAGNIIASGTICDSNGCIGSGGASLWSTSGANIYYSGGNVGIGDNNPEQQLTVYDKFLVRGNNPTITISDDSTPTDRWVMRNQNGAFKLYFDSANPAITVKTSGNVGIGTTAPSQILEVHNSSGDSSLGISSATGNAVFDVVAASGSNALLRLFESTSARWVIKNAGSDSDKLIFTGNGTDRVTIDQVGYMGIGTTSPSIRFDVRPRYANATAMGLSRADGNIMVGFGLSNLATGGAQIRYGDSLSFVGGTATRMYIDEYNGYVGIGLTSPTQALDVAGNIRASGTICDSNGCIGNGGSSVWNNNGAKIYYNSDNVGIGTSNPKARLDVRPSSANAMAMGLSRNDGNVMVGFGLSNLSTGGAQIRYGDSLSFVGGTTTRMYINESNGYVGIGLTSPTQALDVVGNIKASGRMCDSYGCISNWITSGANVYYNGGNVGIGTTAPTARLTIADTISPGQRLLDVGDDAYFTDLDEANAIGLYGIQDSSQVTLQFGSGGARIWGKSNGDICIGNCP